MTLRRMVVGTLLVGAIAVAFVALREPARENSASSVPVPEAPSTTPAITIPVTDISAPDGVYDPIRGGEPTPEGYRDSLGRDWIEPVYNPTFKSADETDWPADSLVIGVEIDGDSRAYPVTFLTRREMVIDTVGGMPVLVSW